MAYEFEKLSEVELVEEFPEGANSLIEDNGEIKRCPSVKGSGGDSKVFHGVITIDMEAEEPTPYLEVDGETSLEELKGLLEAGTPAKVVLTYDQSMDGVGQTAICSFAIDSFMHMSDGDMSADMVVGSNVSVSMELGIMPAYGTYPGVQDEPGWFVMMGK